LNSNTASASENASLSRVDGGRRLIFRLRPGRQVPATDADEVERHLRRRIELSRS
jgi:hypothetical protein